jgi:hypothetical protein
VRSAAGDPSPGRYPDVLASFPGGEIAFEIQLSTTFHPEVLGRSESYRRRGIPLAWLFYGPMVKGLAEEGRSLPASFLDAARRQGDNIFLLDHDGLGQGPLILTAHAVESNGRLGEFLSQVGLDDLTLCPTRGIFFRDLAHARLMRSWAPNREKLDRFGRILGAMDGDGDGERIISTGVETVDVVASWVCTELLGVPELIDPLTRKERLRILEIAAVLFTIRAFVETGQFRNYASNYRTPAAFINWILTRPVWWSGFRYAEALTNRVSAFADRPSTQEMLERARQRHASGQFDKWARDGIEAQVARAILPEIFDLSLRKEMIVEGRLPSWMRPWDGWEEPRPLRLAGL